MPTLLKIARRVTFSTIKFLSSFNQIIFEDIIDKGEH